MQPPSEPQPPSKVELVDRFAKLRNTWVDASSCSIERDELLAVADELRFLESKPALVTLCTQRAASATSQCESLQETLTSLRQSLANSLLAEAAEKFESVSRSAIEQRKSVALSLISPVVDAAIARLRPAAGPSSSSSSSSLSVVPVSSSQQSPEPPGYQPQPAAVEEIPATSEDDYNASIDTLQAMFSVPRRVAARALARARLRLPAAIELLLDKNQRDALIEQSGLVIPPATVQPPSAVPAGSDLINFDAPPPPPPVLAAPPSQPAAAAAVAPPVALAAVAAGAPSVFDLPNLSPRSEALRIAEAAKAEQELKEKAEKYYKQLKEEQANEQLARKLAEEELAARTYLCSICGDSLKLDAMYVLDECSHRFCRECLKGYLLSKINDGRTRDIRCPEVKCSHLVAYTEVRHLVDAATFEKFEKFLLQATLNDDPNTKWCPRAGCGNAVIAVAKGGNMLICNNPDCKFAFCLKCLEPWHADSTCEQYKQWKLENSESDNRFESWAKVNTKQCPHCHAKIEKDGGCNHMTCGKCQHEFCWLCLAEYSDDHFDNGGCEQYT